MLEAKPAALAASEVLSRRAGQDTYLLIEHGRDGRTTAEDFLAPNDASALARAREVSAGAGELWRGGALIARWAPKGRSACG